MLVGVSGVEPETSSLSGTRSNQLSYTPGKTALLQAAQPAIHFSIRRAPGFFSRQPPFLVELTGFEPVTSSLQSWRSSQTELQPLKL